MTANPRSHCSDDRSHGNRSGEVNDVAFTAHPGLMTTDAKHLDLTRVALLCAGSATEGDSCCSQAGRGVVPALLLAFRGSSRAPTADKLSPPRGSYLIAIVSSLGHLHSDGVTALLGLVLWTRLPLVLLTGSIVRLWL